MNIAQLKEDVANGVMIGRETWRKLVDWAYERRQASPDSTLVRYCPECDHIGEVPNGARDCCPDGSHAYRVPVEFARAASLTFQHALSNGTAWGNPPANVGIRRDLAGFPALASPAAGPVGVDGQPDTLAISTPTGPIAAQLKKDAEAIDYKGIIETVAAVTPNEDSKRAERILQMRNDNHVYGKFGRGLAQPTPFSQVEEYARLYGVGYIKINADGTTEAIDPTKVELRLVPAPTDNAHIKRDHCENCEGQCGLCVHETNPQVIAAFKSNVYAELKARDFSTEIQPSAGTIDKIVPVYVCGLTLAGTIASACNMVEGEYYARADVLALFDVAD